MRFGLTEWLTRQPFKARKAVFVVVISTTTIVLVSALIMVLFDEKDYPGYGRAVWWSVQTITTVGYGDVVPTTGTGKSVAALVMLAGIALSSVVTATVTSTFFISAQRRRDRHDPVIVRLEQISERLDEIERRLPPTQT
jgi:voltage-gated potassium channel Kch